MCVRQPSSPEPGRVWSSFGPSRAEHDLTKSGKAIALLARDHLSALGTKGQRRAGGCASLSSSQGTKELSGPGESIIPLPSVPGGAARPNPWSRCPASPQRRRAAWPGLLGLCTPVAIEVPRELRTVLPSSFRPLPALPLLPAQPPSLGPHLPPLPSPQPEAAWDPVGSTCCSSGL